MTEQYCRKGTISVVCSLFPNMRWIALCIRVATSSLLPAFAKRYDAYDAFRLSTHQWCHLSTLPVYAWTRWQYFFLWGVYFLYRCEVEKVWHICLLVPTTNNTWRFSTYLIIITHNLNIYIVTAMFTSWLGGKLSDFFSHCSPLATHPLLWYGKANHVFQKT